MVKVKFIHSPTGYGMAYNAGDECETTPEKAAQLVAAGVAEILPNDEDLGEETPPPAPDPDPVKPEEGEETPEKAAQSPAEEAVEDRRDKTPKEKR